MISCSQSKNCDRENVYELVVFLIFYYCLNWGFINDPTGGENVVIENITVNLTQGSSCLNGHWVSHVILYKQFLF